MKNCLEDYHPLNLDDCIEILNRELDDNSQNEFKNLKNVAQTHHFFGMYLRNTWKLWEQKTPLVKWFKKTYGINHADDISGIILDSWHRDLNGKPRRVAELVKKYKIHWKKVGGY